MIYKGFQDIRLSALGMGCMRLPTVNGDDNAVDEAATRDMVRAAFEGGINYFDTAYGYHGGNSERVMGKILSEYPRDSFYLATKFPGYSPANWPYVKDIFTEQQRRLRTDHFDFYLFHNVCEMNIDAYLDPKYGIYDWLTEKKRDGAIRHLGFSVHGALPVMKRFLEAYGKDMEFCQIQLNYMDWDFQDAKAKVALLEEYGIPVWVMEPLRGGKLAALRPQDEAKLKALRPDETATGWAFRFLQAIPSVTVVLSGMSSMEQLRENLSIFAEDRPLNEREFDTLREIAADILKAGTLPCTACRYCTSHCPQELDIPALIALYNEHKVTTEYGFGFIAPMALSAYPEDKKPGACLGCRSCETVCPQQIGISEMMADFAAMLGE
ncbi:MAG: aldo/keto reductase [Clostridia bacterium]|nr:aldo/keto reductase [Clostridia bacterium]